MQSLVIAPPQEGKGRSFQGLCLASVTANSLWEGGLTGSDNVRPVWSMFAGTENELRPFAANLILGRKAVYLSSNNRKEQKLELLKSFRYQQAWQREPEGSIVTMFLPDLFRHDPGMVDPKSIAFVLLVPKAWAEKEDLDFREMLHYAQGLGYPVEEDTAKLAYLFATYLDRRTRCPIPTDGRFYLQLLCACLQHGKATFSTGDRSYSYYHSEDFGKHSRFGFSEVGTQDVGLLPGIAFHTYHEDFEKLLAEQVTIFFEKTGSEK